MIYTFFRNHYKIFSKTRFLILFNTTKLEKLIKKPRSKHEAMTIIKMAGVRTQPGMGVKVLCLTDWLYPNTYFSMQNFVASQIFNISILILLKTLVTDQPIWQQFFV